MSSAFQTDTGMHLVDLLDDVSFAQRDLRQRPPDRTLHALRRLARIFADRPAVVLQELVDLAVDMCGADSAGISLEEECPGGEKRFRWVAISGSFAQFLNATTPRFFSPCGTCLDTHRPQHYRVTQPYYDLLGVTAEEITDGMLIPWITDGLRGTIWAVAHHSPTAFDLEDYQLLRSLADFAAIVLRHLQQEELLREKARQAASAARANELAHRINNPLQGLVNTIYLARNGQNDTPQLLDQAMQELQALSNLVSEVLLQKPS